MRKKSFYRIDYLFPRGSVLIGMGSLGGIFEPYFSFNTSSSGAQADRKALESDFGTIGEDIRTAISKYKKEWEKR